MADRKKLLQKVKNNPKGVRFEDACRLAEAYGFVFKRHKGSHRMYGFPGYKDQLNLQPLRDGKAKHPQVRQILAAIEELFGDEYAEV